MNILNNDLRDLNQEGQLLLADYTAAPGVDAIVESQVDLKALLTRQGECCGGSPVLLALVAQWELTTGTHINTSQQTTDIGWTKDGDGNLIVTDIGEGNQDGAVQVGMFSHAGTGDADDTWTQNNDGVNTVVIDRYHGWVEQDPRPDTEWIIKVDGVENSSWTVGGDPLNASENETGGFTYHWTDTQVENWSPNYSTAVRFGWSPDSDIAVDRYGANGTFGGNTGNANWSRNTPGTSKGLAGVFANVNPQARFLSYAFSIAGSLFPTPVAGENTLRFKLWLVKQTQHCVYGG